MTWCNNQSSPGQIFEGGHIFSSHESDPAVCTLSRYQENQSNLNQMFSDFYRLYNQSTGSHFHYAWTSIRNFKNALPVIFFSFGRDCVLLHLQFCLSQIAVFFCKIMYRDAAQAEKKQIQGPASLNPWNTGANVSRLKKNSFHISSHFVSAPEQRHVMLDRLIFNSQAQRRRLTPLPRLAAVQGEANSLSLSLCTDFRTPCV